MCSNIKLTTLVESIGIAANVFCKESQGAARQLSRFF
jgi:hypothetical protein